MALYEQFGEFDSYEEINKAAAGQLAEGDTEAIFAIAKENGIDSGEAEDFINGYEKELCTVYSAALGKIDVEAKYLGLKEAEMDYADIIRKACLEDPELAAAVRKKDKSLAGALGTVLKKAWEIKHNLHRDILDAAGLKGNVQSGSPGERKVVKLMKNYYLGGKKK